MGYEPGLAPAGTVRAKNRWVPAALAATAAVASEECTVAAARPLPVTSIRRVVVLVTAGQSGGSTLVPSDAGAAARRANNNTARIDLTIPGLQTYPVSRYDTTARGVNRRKFQSEAPLSVSKGPRDNHPRSLSIDALGGFARGPRPSISRCNLCLLPPSTFDLLS